MPVPTHTADAEDSTDCAEVTCVALTFDDGPAAPHTATLLTYLAAYDARATGPGATGRGAVGRDGARRGDG